ncbi:MAG: hypothetical protein H6713_13600 [Myxococcales bacterium]|nr:hypothetical protein [Myxococcales bacterium]
MKTQTISTIALFLVTSISLAACDADDELTYETSRDARVALDRDALALLRDEGTVRVLHGDDELEFAACDRCDAAGGLAITATLAGERGAVASTDFTVPSSDHGAPLLGLIIELDAPADDAPSDYSAPPTTPDPLPTPALPLVTVRYSDGPTPRIDAVLITGAEDPANNDAFLDVPILENQYCLTNLQGACEHLGGDYDCIAFEDPQVEFLGICQLTP